MIKVQSLWYEYEPDFPQGFVGWVCNVTFLFIDNYVRNTL